MTESQWIEMGFAKAGSCHCNQTLNLKYSKGRWLFYYMPKRRQFYVKFDGHTIKKQTDLKFLKQYIDEETQDPFSKKAVSA